MEIFIDLDNTLFDTDRLDADNARKVHEGLRLDERIYWEAHPEVFKRNNNVYSFSLHADIIAESSGLKQAIVRDFFENMFAQEDSQRYVLAGAASFLDACRVFGKVVILTLGEEENQKRRVRESELERHADSLIVTQVDKGETVKRYLGTKNAKVAAMDDSERHLESIIRYFPEALTVHFVSRTGKETKSQRHIPVKSYEEALLKIKNFAKT